MEKIFCDFESTGTNPYTAEVITGFFLKEDGDSYDFKSQVISWSDEASQIHKITYEEMLSYPEKKDAMDGLVNWLPGVFEMVVYANPQTKLGYLLYDVVLLKMNLMNYYNVDKESQLPFTILGTSVHTLARACHNLGLFEPIKNESTNRYSFSQQNVYRALFDSYYNAHNAKSDVLAMKRIYDRLNHIKKTGIADKGQIQLI